MTRAQAANRKSVDEEEDGGGDVDAYDFWEEWTADQRVTPEEEPVTIKIQEVIDGESSDYFCREVRMGQQVANADLSRRVMGCCYGYHRKTKTFDISS